MSSDDVQKLGMPKWGLSMTEGRLVAWLVDEGADIAVGDEVAEVETDKLNGAVESPVEGVLRRRVASPGETIPVGGLLGVVAGAETSEADIDAFVADFEASFVPGESEEDAGPEPETVEVGAGTLRYLRQGEGDDTVVLLHGFGGDLNNWLFATPALATEHTVYALELPGHGGSSKNVGPGDLDFFVDAVAQFLDTLQIERAHLVGHSLGGLVAASLTLRDPSRARSLTLVSSCGLGEEINGEYLDGFITASSRRELKPALELLFADSGQVTRQLVDDVLKYKRIDGVDAALRSIADHVFGEGRQHVLVADRLSELGVPLLVVWGEQDQIIPSEHARHVPDSAEVVVLEGSGHSPHMEAAGDVNRVMEKFLAGV
jgi:pyruvate dehydrogenase E2 component (dihydrolipoyllysine-residue acetyltransferase)